MELSKGRKIARRTFVGGSLVLALALLLWLASESATGAPLFAAATIVLFAVCVEVSRMGTLALLGAFPALLCSAVVAVVFAQVSHEGRLVTRDYATLGATHTPAWLELGRAYSATAIAGASAFVLVAAGQRWLRSAALARFLAYAGVGSAVLWAVRDFHSERSSVWPALGALALLGLVAGALVLRGSESVRRAAAVGLLGAWIAVPLPLLWTFWATAGGSGDPTRRTSALVALLVLSKIGDTAGYYAGSAIGRSHPFPRISPGKTTEGCLASFAAAVLAAVVLQRLRFVPDGRFGVWSAALAGALVNLAAQAGDLLESWVKRRAGVKDSSRWFGPSGGLLDQVDSLLLSAPAGALAWGALFVS